MKRLLTIISVILGVLFIARLFYPIQCLTIRSYDPPVENHLGLIKAIPMKEGEVFIASNIHSVSLTPLKEYFYPADGKIALQEVRYVDQGGAGMPEYEWGSNEKFENKGDYFVISGFDRSFKELIINVQKDYDNKLLFPNKGQREIKFIDFVKDQSRVALKIERLTLGQWIYSLFI